MHSTNIIPKTATVYQTSTKNMSNNDHSAPQRVLRKLEDLLRTSFCVESHINNIHILKIKVVLRSHLVHLNVFAEVGIYRDSFIILFFGLKMLSAFSS